MLKLTFSSVKARWDILLSLSGRCHIRYSHVAVWLRLFWLFINVSGTWNPFLSLVQPVISRLSHPPTIIPLSPWIIREWRRTGMFTRKWCKLWYSPTVSLVRNRKYPMKKCTMCRGIFCNKSCWRINLVHRHRVYFLMSPMGIQPQVRYSESHWISEPMSFGKFKILHNLLWISVSDQLHTWQTFVPSDNLLHHASLHGPNWENAGKYPAKIH